MRKTVLAAGMATLLGGAGPALAIQAGAPAPQPTQPGAWGPQGWQPGTAGAAAPGYAPPTIVATAPMPPAQPGFGAATAPAPIAQPAPVDPHVYDQIERGRKVKGPAVAAANTVPDPADWGLPQPPAGMRWIRYYDDAVLLDANDRAIDVRSVPWDAMPRGGMPGYGPGYAPSYAGGAGYPMAMGPARMPGRYTTRQGSIVTTTQVLPPPAMVGGMYGPYGQVVAVTPGTITTTTRTVWVRGGRPSHYHAVHRRCGCRR